MLSSVRLNVPYSVGNYHLKFSQTHSMPYRNMG